MYQIYSRVFIYRYTAGIAQLCQTYKTFKLMLTRCTTALVLPPTQSYDEKLGVSVSPWLDSLPGCELVTAGQTVGQNWNS